MRRYLLLLAFLSSCGIGAAYDKEIRDGYTFLALDTKDDMVFTITTSDGYRIGVIGAKVTEYFVNDKFFIIKQVHDNFHSNENYFEDRFFIVPISETPKKTDVLGPFIKEKNVLIKLKSLYSYNETIIFNKL